MRWFKMRRRNRAFALIEVMAATTIMASLQSQGGFQYAITRANEVRGVHNLKQIHTLLYAQTIGGTLPNAVFYPKDDPKKDPKSIMRLIQGAPPELFVSPFAPEGLKQKGLTYAWNDTVNGKDMTILNKNTWLLIDLAAFIADPAVQKPSRYLVLYADGRATATAQLPGDIAEAVAKARPAKEGEKKPVKR